MHIWSIFQNFKCTNRRFDSIYVDEAKQQENPEILFKYIISMMTFMIRHCESNNTSKINFSEKVNRYTQDIAMMLKTHQKLSKNHNNMGNDIKELEEHLKNHLANMIKDDKEAKDQNSESNGSGEGFQKPITSFFKAAKKRTSSFESFGDTSGSKKGTKRRIDEIQID